VQASKLYLQLEKHLELEWIYESSTEAIEQTETITPPLAQLQIYHQLLAKGRIEAIACEAKKLAENHTEYRGFADKVLAACHDFDLQSLQILLFTEDQAIAS